MLIIKIWQRIIGFYMQMFDAFINLVFFCIYYKQSLKAPPLKVNKYLSGSAIDLANKIKNGQLKSEQVVRAYIDRIRDVNPIINAITDDSRYQVALAEAQNIDKNLELGLYSDEFLMQKPLLGVPFSVKDSIDVKDCLRTFGLVILQDTAAEDDADVIKFIIAAGGIPLVKTNTPEMNHWTESYNNVFGLTKNPYNSTRTVGGSSGGDAALVAACGVPWGLGSDAGGSIRLPAFFCGLFGHYVTPGLVSVKGVSFRTGNEQGPCMLSPGPLTRYADDLAPLLKVILGNKSQALRLDDEVDLSKIKIYFMEDSNEQRCSKISKDLQKALIKVVTNLAPICHSCTPISIDGVQYSYNIWRYWSNQEFTIKITDFVGRDLSPLTELLKRIIGKSSLTLYTILTLLNEDHTAPENSEWAEQMTTNIKQKLLEILGDDGVLIYPSGPYPAPYHYTAFFRPYNFSYLALFNALHMPVTQVPIGLNDEGLPLGVQVVASPYKDHLSIAIAKELEFIFGGWVPPFEIPEYY